FLLSCRERSHTRPGRSAPLWGLNRQLPILSPPGEKRHDFFFVAPARDWRGQGRLVRPTLFIHELENVTFRAGDGRRIRDKAAAADMLTAYLELRLDQEH